MKYLQGLRMIFIIIIGVIVFITLFEYREKNEDNLPDWYYIYNTKTKELKQVHFELVFRDNVKGHVNIESLKKGREKFTLVRISKKLSVSFRDKILNSLHRSTE